MTSIQFLRVSLMLSGAWIAAGTAAAQTPLSPDPQQTPTPPSAAVTTGTTAADSPSSGGLADIVVTARRTEENLQTTPVAVTALGTEAIKQAQITDAAAIQRTAPSLSIATGSPGNSGFTFVSIRGAGTLNPGVANDPSVAIYVDGVYVPRPSQGITDLQDIQRVEVLRGPQGTLFGRNTTGGALNIVTANPTGDFEGQVRVQAGNYDYRNVGAIVNLPLMGESLALRVVYDFTDRDGYARDVTTNHPLNDRNSHFARAKLRWAPADSDWSVTLAADYNRLKDSGQFVGLSGYLPTANPLIGLAGNLDAFLHTKANFYTTFGPPFSGNSTVAGGRLRTGDQAYNHLEAYGGSATIEGELGAVAVKSITAYRYSFSVGRNELDGTPLQILGTESYYLSKQYSQELQFSGDLNDRMSYIFGGYYSNEKGEEQSHSQTFGFFPPASPPPNRGFARNLADVKNNSLGVFGQGYYKITEALRFSAGLRWTWDKRDVVLHNLTNVALNTCSPEITGLPGFVAPCSFPRKAKFDYPAWTAGLDYQVSDQLFLYLKTSGAAKAGGWNLRNGSASTPPFAPEKVKDVEFGVKADAFDNRLRANMAVFYAWQSAVQRNASGLVQIGNTQTTTQFLLNAGKQEVYGAEFEVSAVPWEGMTVNANLSLLRGSYVDGSFTEVRDIPGANLPGCTPVPNNPAQSRCVVDRSGEKVPQLPRSQFNVSATQRVPTGFGELTFHANYSYIAKQDFDTQTADPRQSAAAQAAIARQNELGTVPSYGLFDGRIALQLEKPNLELFTFAKNIGGKKYVTRSFNSLYSSLGVAFEYVGSPFTWGVGATFRFGPN